MKIINFLQAKVKEKGSQTTVARKIGVSQGTIAKICLGDQTPSLETLQKIAKAYDLPISFFTNEPISNALKKEELKIEKEAASIEEVLTAAGVPTASIGYVKWFSLLPEEKQQEIFAEKFYSIGGDPIKR